VDILKAIETELLNAPRVIVVLCAGLFGEATTRDDPFWKSGGFGCTGCHCRNLLDPNRAGEL
jgi:hypothetical protein